MAIVRPLCLLLAFSTPSSLACSGVNYLTFLQISLVGSAGHYSLPVRHFTLTSLANSARQHAQCARALPVIFTTIARQHRVRMELWDDRVVISSSLGLLFNGASYPDVFHLGSMAIGDPQGHSRHLRATFIQPYHLSNLASLLDGALLSFS